MIAVLGVDATKRSPGRWRRKRSTFDARSPPAEREHLDHELAPARRAVARRVARLLPALAGAVVAFVSRPSTPGAEAHSVLDNSLTGIFISASRSRSSCAERPSVVR